MSASTTGRSDRTHTMSLPVLLVFVTTAMLLTGCSEATPEAKEELPPIEITPAMTAVADSVMLESGPVLSGKLKAEREAQLRPQVGGTIVSLRVRAGEHVRRGEILAIIDTTVLADQVRSVRLALSSDSLAAESAERNRSRSEELFKAGAIAKRDLEDASDAAARAMATLENSRTRFSAAREQLSDATIRAPFTGIVSEVPVSLGDVVQVAGGGPIAVVVDPTTLELDASVPASNLAAMKPGVKVAFAVPSQPGERFEGEIARVNPTVDPTTGQVQIYVRIPNDSGQLAAGLFAEGRVAVERRRALAIPLAALDRTALVSTVKRLRAESVAAVEVKLGMRDELAQRVEVVSGLVPGDTVLQGGALGTPNGARVKIVQVDR